MPGCFGEQCRRKNFFRVHKSPDDHHSGVRSENLEASSVGTWTLLCGDATWFGIMGTELGHGAAQPASLASHPAAANARRDTRNPSSDGCARSATGMAASTPELRMGLDAARAAGTLC